MNVAVVIPNWNGARWLDDCLDSVLAQTAAPAEILVVDNGSTDGSADLAVQRPGVRVLALGRNAGFAVAANRGFAALSPDVEAVVVTSSRTPDERRGDLDSQRGANKLGVKRLADVVTQAGSAAPLAEVVDYGERRMRAALRELPDGQFRFEDVLDSAGPRPQQQSPTRVVVTVTLDGEHAKFDFTGTDAQRAGNGDPSTVLSESEVSNGSRRRSRVRMSSQREPFPLPGIW